jgi:EAL domain-containing protein (putative c-di-GMP-specific phosphodiesterase class I)
LLVKMNCDQLQGSLFHQPVALEKLNRDSMQMPA